MLFPGFVYHIKSLLEHHAPSAMEVKFIAEAFLLINHIFVIRDCWNDGWTEGDVLSLAAGVESNTNHPLGKAIMEAAQAANCINMKVLIFFAPLS
jgi:hypothetical protein